jgi:hypothetical protein
MKMHLALGTVLFVWNFDISYRLRHNFCRQYT